MFEISISKKERRIECPVDYHPRFIKGHLPVSSYELGVFNYKTDHFRLMVACAVKTALFVCTFDFFIEQD